MIGYLDTSVALKLYVMECDSPAWLSWVATQNAPLPSSQLLKIELAYALSQKEQRGEIFPGAAMELFQHFLTDVAIGRFTLLPLDDGIFITSLKLAFSGMQMSSPLRTLDGLHLSTVLTHGFTHIVTADQRLAAAARRLGVTPVLP